MIRRIIQIDEEKCNGCGACAKACHEGAISMVNGKAKLMRDDYCDGLGDCLPNCPVDAIHFVEREAAAYDAEAVKQNMLKKQQEEAAKQNAGDHYIHSAILDLSVLLIRSGVIQLCIILTVAGKIQRLCCAVFLQQIHIFSKRVSGYIHSKNRLL